MEQAAIIGGNRRSIERIRRNLKAKNEIVKISKSFKILGEAFISECPHWLSTFMYATRSLNVRILYIYNMYVHM
jgi:hypothetical protein